MVKRSAKKSVEPDAADVVAFPEIVGYLNFSSGRPEPKFQAHLNQLALLHPNWSWTDLRAELVKAVDRLHGTSVAFENCDQARRVIAGVFDQLVPAYRHHHRDLLTHLTDGELQSPLFLARLFEALLAEFAEHRESMAGPVPASDTTAASDPASPDAATAGPPSTIEPIPTEWIAGALARLNDFLGFRPIAVLENGRRMEAYAHERCRPIPLYLRGVGVAAGRWRKLIEATFELLAKTPEDLRNDAYFQLEHLDELALDPRSHDHLHPVNKRTNYLFGEWDPSLIDIEGNYRRFVVRKVILDALLQWMSEQKRVAEAEVVYDAAVVLAGTILMASSISGSGPATHDSTVSLTTLLPKVARQRDEFYARVLQTTEGPRAKRLQRHARVTQQPFGHVRQYLNMYLAQYGSQQIQRRHIAYLFSRMGFPDAARKQAEIIRCTAARFESELQWRITAARLQLHRGQPAEAARLLQECEELLQRGIECGALVDPWNILGFQGQFPLFSSREDSVPDNRIELLLQLVEMILETYGLAYQEAAITGQTAVLETLPTRFEAFAAWWDRFGSTTVSDLPPVSGQDSFNSARHVAEALSEWRQAGEQAGQMLFWRDHVEHFRSAKAYAQVVDALIRRKDLVASMGLLMQWLSVADEVGLESAPLPFTELALVWLEAAVDPATVVPDRWKLIARMFASLEANSASFWMPPRLSEAINFAGEQSQPPGPRQEIEEDEDEQRERHSLFGAAYEEVVYRDSADDGQWGDVADDRGPSSEPSEFEHIERFLEPHLRFLRMLVRMYQLAAAEFAVAHPGTTQVELEPGSGFSEGHVENWLQHVTELQKSLDELLRSLWQYQLIDPSGDHDSNVEFDVQLQTKYYVTQSVIATQLSCRSAQWCLCSLLSEKASREWMEASDRAVVAVYRSVLRQDLPGLRKHLLKLMTSLQNKPLLYVPLDHGGHPGQVLTARTNQAIIRFLLAHLPQLGLLRETWHLLQLAHRMEQMSRPDGMAVTEFDRLFRIALRTSLESLVDATSDWKGGKFTDEELIETVGTIVEHYLDQWLEHSSTMRLSSVEMLKLDGVWEDVRAFIEEYGQDFLHARMMTLGNLRTILHNGVANYLKYLGEESDRIVDVKLLQDIESGSIAIDDAAEILELIYQIVVDRFDRFLEYNTTTTQSDYGQYFYGLLDFLRLEISYDRDAWNLMPVALSHEVLTAKRRLEAARIWEEVFVIKTEEMADRHQRELVQLERKYGMKLPGITNHFNERFVKPLIVNYMVGLIPLAVQDVDQGRTESASFDQLASLVEEYLTTSSGSGLEVPAWLRALEDELNDGQTAGVMTRGEAEPELRFPGPALKLTEMRQQLKTWRNPLTRPRGKK